MTADDLLKTCLSVVLAAVSAVVAWLVKTTLGTRDDALRLGEKVRVLEHAVEELKKEALTVECIREVVEGALDRRDDALAERRIEWDKMHTLEIRQVVADELERMLPRIIRELRGSSGIDTPNFNAPKPKGRGSDA